MTSQSARSGGLQSGGLQFVVTNTLIVRDIQRSIAFYRDVLGAMVLREGEPTFLRLGNFWLIINVGGGPTDDKPEVLASPPRDQNILSFFLNLRVTNIRRYYDLWSSRGAKFITEPKVLGPPPKEMSANDRCGSIPSNDVRRIMKVI